MKKTMKQVLKPWFERQFSFCRATKKGFQFNWKNICFHVRGKNPEKHTFVEKIYAPNALFGP